MRRSFAAGLLGPAVSLVLAVTVLSASSESSASPATAQDRVLATGGAKTAPELVAARSALAETTAVARRADRPDASLALRDLFTALPTLSGGERRQAQGLLARPTDGAADPLQDGYTVPATRRCRAHFCLHWVTSTADAPSSGAWVSRTLKYMNHVWRREVKGLGYRKPISDGTRGGNGRFDVYLKDLGSQGLYGYCTPERRAAGSKWLASGYCVLDNDFASSQYGGAAPGASLQVTAAHEFFHAIQFAYDYGEDPWLMEATATWMEERVADHVNDNRQYLPYGQVGAPGQPLDVFKQQGFNQYGNWAFFEYLSGRFGAGIVRSIWTRAGAYPGSGHQYSTTAVKGVLAGHGGGFAGVYRSFSAGNITPGRTYAEGASWPAPPASRSWTLTKADADRSTRLAIDHMSSRNLVVRPSSTMQDKRWGLRVAVDGPGAGAAPSAAVVLRSGHGVQRRTITLDGKGKGATTVPFSSGRVRSATVVLVNGSTRFSCWHRTTWSCQGRAQDNDKAFVVHASAHRARHS